MAKRMKGMKAQHKKNYGVGEKEKDPTTLKIKRINLMIEKFIAVKEILTNCQQEMDEVAESFPLSFLSYTYTNAGIAIVYVNGAIEHLLLRKKEVEKHG